MSGHGSGLLMTDMIIKKLLIRLFIITSLLYGYHIHAEDNRELYFIDAHSQIDHQVSGINLVLERMAANNVTTTLLATRGKRNWREILEWNTAYPDKIIPLIRSKGKDYQNNSPEYYKRINRQIDTGKFQGPAEILIYHAQKGTKAPEVVVDFTDKRVTVLLDPALVNGWPFIIHVEFASLHGGKRRQHMNDLKVLLNKYPKHPFALIHMGQLQADEVCNLLEAHSNLYFITSHVDPSVSNSRQPWVNIFDGYQFKKVWKSLFIAYPERFIFALDNVWAKHWGITYDEKMEYWRRALSKLPQTSSHLIAHGNAERLWKLK